MSTEQEYSAPLSKLNSELLWSLELIKASDEYYMRYSIQGASDVTLKIPKNHEKVATFEQKKNEPDDTFWKRVEFMCKQMGIGKIINFSE